MIDRDIYEQIENLAEDEIQDVFYALTEEVGELALALHVDRGTKQRKLKEPTINEVIDIILVAIEMYIRLGGKFENLYKIAQIKLEKWENSVERRGIF